MHKDFKSGADNIVKNLRELQKLTSNEKGAQRVAWGEIWQKACQWIEKKFKETGASIRKDSAGNIWATIEGKSREIVLIGSHIDSVPNGGWLDGCLGVVAGLEVLNAYSKHQEKPDKTICVVNWADEEGARFGRSLMGSSAACGKLKIEEIKNLKDNDGFPIANVLKANGVILENMVQAYDEFKKLNIIASLEFHIEQGPVLESRNREVACVYGITGVERHFIKFKGQSAHAGSFPTEMRQDAFLAAAKASLLFRDIALKYNAVCTVGKVKLFPDVVTIVPGECIISLDQRSICKGTLAKMHEEAVEITKLVAREFKTSVDWEKIWTIEPTIFDEKLISMCLEAIKEETGYEEKIFSGPLHDSAEVARHFPSVMMFVMSEKGLSHCKEENTSDDKLKIASKAFLRLTNKVIESYT